MSYITPTVLMASVQSLCVIIDGLLIENHSALQKMIDSKN